MSDEITRAVDVIAKTYRSIPSIAGVSSDRDSLIVIVECWVRSSVAVNEPSTLTDPAL